MKVFDNIILVSGFANCYIIEREQECVLVDTGMSTKAKKITQTIKTNIPNKPLKSIILTHSHQDHLAGLATLNQLYEPSIVAHREESPFIMKTRNMPTRKDFDGFILKLFDRIMRIKGHEVHHEVEDNEEIHGLRVLHLPGHTPGTIALIDLDTQALFCGDIINTDKKGSKILPPSEKYALDYNQAIKSSIKMFDKVSPSVVLPGHGSPVFEPADAIKIYLDEYSKV